MRPSSPVVLVLLVLAACAPRPGAEAPAPVLTRQATGADSVLFIGVSPVDARTVWLAGTGGTYARTLDGGTTWRTGTVPGADTLQFRDVHAVSADEAYLLSIGSGAASRIYKTTDGGATWRRQWTNEDPAAFFDCFGFWDADHGIAFSDGVGGALPLVRTDDGETWTRLAPAAPPPAREGEGSFAASGTCLVTHGDATAWIGTGAVGPAARVLKTTDRGRTWTAAETPIGGGAAAGIASLAFRDARRGMALGGDVAQRLRHSDNVAVTADGGATWTLAAPPTFAGAVYGAAYAPGTGALVAVGPGGMALTRDDARTWAPLDSLNHWSVGFAGSTGWAVGPQGRVTRIDLE